MDIFKEASRLKLRVNTSRGQLTVEQLWDLSLKELNAIAVSLNKKLKAESVESYLDEVVEEDVESKLIFEITLDILKTKKSEAKALSEAAEIKRHNKKIDDLIAAKLEKSLEDKSIEELQAMRK